LKIIPRFSINAWPLSQLGVCSPVLFLPCWNNIPKGPVIAEKGKTLNPKTPTFHRFILYHNDKEALLELPAIIKFDFE
jgi:hypothetical protein